MRTLFAKRGLGIATRHLAWLALGFFGMLLALAVLLARLGANRLLDATRWYGALTSNGQTIGWDGRITLEQAKFVPHGDNEAGGLSAERVTISTGGPIWLMRLALRRTSADRLERRRKELEASGVLQKDDAPSVLPPVGRLELTAQNVRFGPESKIARWMPWLDPSNGVLFASLGCREADGLSHAVARRAGDSGRFDLKVKLTQQREATLVAAVLDFGGISNATWQGSFLPSSNLGLLAGDWRHWQMVEQKWTLRDREFVRARNRECARRLALPRPQFVARHALAVKRQLAAWRIALPAPLEQAYREHASVGGDIVFVSRPKQPLRLGEYQLMSRSQRVGALDGHVQMAGRRLPLLLEFLPDPMPASTLLAATTDTLVPTALVVAVPPAAAPVRPEATTPANHVASSSVAANSVPVRNNDSAVLAKVVAPSARPTAQSAAGATPAAIPDLAGKSRAAASMPASAQRVAGLTSSTADLAGASTPAPTPPSQGNYGGLIGRRVTITTTYGTARTGKIKIANTVAVTLEMQTNNGPIQLRIPAEQIVRVRSAPL